MKIILLGVPTIYCDQDVVEIKSKKSWALLAYLLLNRQRVHARETLAELIWPTLDNKKRSLSQDLHKLNKALHPVKLFAATDTTLTIHPDATFQLDVETLLGATDNLPTNTSELRQLADLCQGELLAGLDVDTSADFEQWLVAQRNRLMLPSVRILERTTRVLLADEQIEASAHYARQLCDAFPQQPEGYRCLMQVLLKDNQPMAAWDIYERYLKLCCDANMDPAPEIRALAVKVEKAIARRSTLHTLPAPTTAIIGRDVELAQITAWLGNPHKRLITILGPGGIGKTHLAIATGWEQLDADWDEVHFVGLSSIGAERFLATVAQCLGIQSPTDRDLLPVLTAYLRPRAILLILDNFEHILECASDIQKLLEAAPQLHVIVTSREKLYLQGEVQLTLAGVNTAHTDQQLSQAALMFIEFAAYTQPDLTLGAKQRELISEICVRVAGMPLALRLLAGWLDMMSLTEIRAELEVGYDIIHSDGPTAPKRHDSFEAVFEHSWSLLTPVQRDALAGLSIFVGGFERPAAESVGVDLPTLRALTSKSLIAYNIEQQRYTIHELLRYYARKKLAAKPHSERKAQDAFVAYCISLNDHFLYWCSAEEYIAGILAMQRNFDNYQAAWRWACANRNLSQINDLLLGMSHICHLSGMHRYCYEEFGLLRQTLAPFGSSREERLLNARLIAHEAYFQINVVSREVEVNATFAALDRAAEMLTEIEEAAFDRVLTLCFAGGVAALLVDDNAQLAAQYSTKAHRECAQAGFIPELMSHGTMMLNAVASANYQSCIEHGYRLLDVMELNNPYMLYVGGLLALALCKMERHDEGLFYIRHTLQLMRRFPLVYGALNSANACAAYLQAKGNTRAALRLAMITTTTPLNDSLNRVFGQRLLDELSGGMSPAQYRQLEAETAHIIAKLPYRHGLLAFVAELQAIVSEG